jgi:hypothetical protein
MIFRKLAPFFICFFVVLVGCGAAPAEDDSNASAEALGIVDDFPPRESIDFAMDGYLRDPASARARAPTSVGDFFGQGATSMNIDHLRVEFLKPNPRFSDKPIAFLHAHFYGGDTYWNDRFKDVQLFRLVDSTGTAKNPFPEAAHVPSEGAAIVRVWSDFHAIKKGAPPGLEGDALMVELARMAVWSYVGGNVDGVANNGSNGGFSRFRDASGREFWRGVLIDEGAAWNTPPDAQKPWNTNLLGRGAVQRAHIPDDVANSLIQIARGAPDDLARKSRFEHVDEGALNIVRGIQGRAREILDHYGIAWKTAQVIPLRRPNVPVRKAA